MSVTPGTAEPAAPNPAPPPYGDPAAAPQAPQPGTNGLAVAGLILAFLIAPIGFILSLVGLIQAGKRGQKGKGLAVGGIIVSLVAMTTFGVVAFLVAQKVTTLVDPGCTDGKTAILASGDRLTAATDPESGKQALQASIDELNAAAAKSNKAEVRSAVKAIADDYNQMLQSVKAGEAPSDSLQKKLEADAATFDKHCSVGTK
jgi:hypothetical protein